MLRHRLLDLIPDRLRGPILDRYWQRREAEFEILPHVLPPGGTAVDIGVWWGPWTSAMAKIAGTVHAFEPQPRLAAAARRRMPANVTVHETALSNTAGSAQLWMPASKPGLDALASIRANRTSLELDREGTFESYEVTTSTLDSYELGTPHFIKIDVEGHEREVLEGAAHTLATSRPDVLVEIEQRHHVEPITAVFEIFAALEYTGWFLRDRRWTQLATFDVERDQLRFGADVHDPGYINNFLFLRDQRPPLT